MSEQLGWHGGIIKQAPQTWRWGFTSKMETSFTFTGKPPNAFHRLMLRVCLGIHSELIPQEPQEP